MRIDDEVWTSASVDPLEMVAVLRLCDADRHLLLLSPSGRERATQWIHGQTRDGSAMRARLLHVLEANRRRATNAAEDGVQISVVANATDWSRARLAAPLASRLLGRPLKLLVENSRNDRAFLLQIAEPAASRELKKAIEAGWIEFEMGGGLHEIHQRIRSFSNSAGPLPDHARIELARLWVMFDRDADPSDRTQESQHSRRVREDAAKLTIPWPLAANQLERRAIENYIPTSVLRDWWCTRAKSSPSRVEREQRVEAFLDVDGLSTNARRSYNMKRGLLGDVSPQRRAEIRKGGPPLTDGDLDPIFHGLKPALRDRLAGGGFDDVAAAFAEPGVIRSDALHKEVGPAERRRLVASIRDRM